MTSGELRSTGIVQRTERAFRQDAELAMGGDPIRAIVELVTNSDDAYVSMETAQNGRIRIEVERDRPEGTIVRVNDWASGMTPQEVKDRLARDGVRSSGFERGVDVRGVLGRGAKDCAAFGPVEWVTVKHGTETTFRLEPTGLWECVERPAPPQGRDGTSVTLTIEPRFSLRQHANLAASLQRHYALRPCLLDRTGREVLLVEAGQGRETHLVYDQPSGTLVEHAVLPVAGFEGESISIELFRAGEQLDDGAERDYWRHGILIKSGRATYENFGGKFEREPWSQYLGRLFGTAEIPGIARLIRDYDDRLERGEPPTEANPIRMVSRHRHGLVDRAEHPFVAACYAAIEAFLAPHIEELRAETEPEASAEGLSSGSRRRLRALGRVLGDIIEEQEDAGVPGHETHALPPPGVSFIPATSVVAPGGKAHIDLRVRPGRGVSPGEPPLRATLALRGPGELSSGEVDLLARDGYFSRAFSVSGLPEGATCVVVAAVSGASGETVVRCRPEPEPVPVERMAFEHRSYRLREGRHRRLRLLIPWERAVSPGGVEFALTGDSSIALSAQTSAVAYDQARRCGVAVAEITGHVAGARATIHGRFGDEAVAATITITSAASHAVVVELVPEEHPQRAVWDGNILKVSASDPSVSRYLGPQSEGWPGQESLHFRALLAEIVAFHVVRRIVEQRPLSADAAAAEVYRQHLQLEQTCLQRIHAVLLPGPEV